ncbi:hypothetical protein IQ266_04660 [filamentous cyanobacterium LEGE 11480]|uniref:Polyketide synthase n=1 Tax=Romeriopsis navalis LEGE 11480 TaxID=2777977 RepID=A0A928VLX3_9CYAN|nr:type I polyketide synthase [Romeriopsis navalis]MBE9029051.1 hypothetical protein [Romeriopsis navalis LEGE 11480]
MVIGKAEIAIIGIGCRFPGASTPDEFWKLLQNGVDAVTQPPTDRIGINYSNLGSGLDAKSTWGGFLKEIDQFDPRFFGITPAEATLLDPQQRLLLEVTWNALEDAGQVIANLAGSQTGVFLGIGSGNHYSQLVAATDEPSVHDLTSDNTAIAANRISFQFNFQGPSVAINTACSSSLVAVHQACQSLLLGESTLAVAGGVNLLLSGQSTVKLAKAGLISSAGRCCSFDANADGYVRGETVGVVILKPLAQAQADGDRIYGVIQGSAVNHNGRGNGLTAPNPQSQKSLLKRAYEQANISPAQVQYIEANGSATSLGDALELKAIGEVVAIDRTPESRCAIGSVKTNIGNAETASGIAGLLKVALALKHQKLPPTLHFQQPNPNLALDQLPIEVPTSLTDWPLTDNAFVAGVSSFGLGGTNAHVVIEGRTAALLESEPLKSEQQTRGRPTIPSQEPALLLLSAKSEASLKYLVQNYFQFLSDCSELRLLDVCYTASVRRSHFAYRLAIVAHSIQDLCDQLSHLLPKPPAEFCHKVSRRRRQNVPQTVDEPDASLVALSPEVLLNNLARQWYEGVEINWSDVYADRQCQFIDVPTYPFDRQSYWVASKEQSDSAAMTPPENTGFSGLNTPYAAPENELQQKIVTLWQTLLRVDSVGIHDHFIELGGTSVIAAQLVIRLWDDLFIELPISSIFEYPTVADQAALIAQRLSEKTLTEQDDMHSLLAEMENLSDDDAQLLLGDHF